MSIETILTIGIAVNIIGWICVINERIQSRILHEELLNIHRLNYEMNRTSQVALGLKDGNKKE